MNIHIIITATVNPTENEDKVLHAIRNLVDGHGNIKIKVLGIAKKEIIVDGGPELLSNLKHEISVRQIQPLVRNLLLKNKIETTSFLLLNKQALYANRIVICESPSESPLGPVKIKIETNSKEDLDLIIYWLTEEGKSAEINL